MRSLESLPTSRKGSSSWPTSGEYRLGGKLISEMGSHESSPTMTVVLVTHEADVARFARRILRFRDGRVVSDEINSPVEAALAE